MSEYAAVKCTDCGKWFATTAKKIANCPFCPKKINLNNPSTIIRKAESGRDCTQMVRELNAKLIPTY